MATRNEKKQILEALKRAQAKRMDKIRFKKLANINESKEEGEGKSASADGDFIARWRMMAEGELPSTNEAAAAIGMCAELLSEDDDSNTFRDCDKYCAGGWGCGACGCYSKGKTAADDSEPLQKESKLSRMLNLEASKGMDSLMETFNGIPKSTLFNVLLENKVDEAVTGGKQCLGEPVDNGNGTYTSKKCGGCPCGEGYTCIKGPGLGKSVGRGGEPSDDDDMDLGPKRR